MINQSMKPVVAEKPLAAVPPPAMEVPPSQGCRWAGLGLKILGGLLVADGLAVFGLTVPGMLICH